MQNNSILIQRNFMLSFESLIDQAKSRGMPTTKMRGILREYLQILILKELYKTKSGKKLYFTGGTYLRLAHELKRFSEDLDFNTKDLSQDEFEQLMEMISKELKRAGIKSKVEFSHWENLFVAKLIFRDIEANYNIQSKYSKKSGIIIKIETNKPKWKIIKESQVISGFGQFFPCLCTDKSILFADKIDALIKKNRARHIYDIIFMLSNKYPIEKQLLMIYGVKTSPSDAIKNRISNFSNTELKKYAETLRPFLFDENEADLIINAKQFIPLLIEKYDK